jgi:multiple sugar transport system substrate-binding protein
MFTKFFVRLGLLLCLGLMFGARLCGESAPSGRTVVTYWEKWTGFEGEALRAAVEQFNRAQDEIWVDLVTMSQMDRKLIVATAGGTPPDLAGIWLPQVASFADRSALTALDQFILAEPGAREAGPEAWLRARYSPAYATLGRYQKNTYAIVSSAATSALYWNKAAFRAAGLDPERPPRTVAELDAFARKLSRRSPEGGGWAAIGFLPQEPGWFSHAWTGWFGGELFDADGRVSFDQAASRRAWAWEQSYLGAYGAEELKEFTSGFGGFASSQQAFFTGRVAMVFQGSWMDRFIREFAPGLEYGVAPWPEAGGAKTPARLEEAFTVVDADVWVIPRGAKNPAAAWRFLRWMIAANPGARTRAEVAGVELLALGQEKPSPLREQSAWVLENHPHPHGEFFRRLAESPRAWAVPRTGIWMQYQREIYAGLQHVRLGERSPEEAARYVQARVEEAAERQALSSARQAARAGEGEP